MLERAVSGVGFLLALVVVVVMVRTFMLSPRSIAGPPCKPLDTDFINASQKLVDNFRQALRFQTVSRDFGDYNRKDLLQFQAFIKKSMERLFTVYMFVKNISSIFLDPAQNLATSTTEHCRCKSRGTYPLNPAPSSMRLLLVLSIT